MNGSREPVAVINVLTTLVEASLMLAVSFGLPLTNEQVGAIGAAILAVGNVWATLKSRSQVTPVIDPMDNHGERLSIN